MTDSIPETTLFHLRHPVLGIIAVGVAFDPGPTVAYWIAGKMLRVYASLDDLGSADEVIEDTELVHGPPELGIVTELREMNIAAGGPVTVVAGSVPRRAVEDSEVADVATLGRRLDDPSVTVDLGSNTAFVRADALPDGSGGVQ